MRVQRKPENIEIGKRFQQFRDVKNISRNDIAGNACLDSAEQVKSIELGRVKISMPVVRILQLRYGLNPEWLITGSGDMISDAAKQDVINEFGIKTGEGASKYNLLLDPETKAPLPDNGSLITVIDWLIDEYGGDNPAQMLLIGEMLRLFPTLREYLQKKQTKEHPMGAETPTPQKNQANSY